jgi:hypothetical protein
MTGEQSCELVGIPLRDGVEVRDRPRDRVLRLQIAVVDVQVLGGEPPERLHLLADVAGQRDRAHVVDREPSGLGAKAPEGVQREPGDERQRDRLDAEGDGHADGDREVGEAQNGEDSSKDVDLSIIGRRAAALDTRATAGRPSRRSRRRDDRGDR